MEDIKLLRNDFNYLRTFICKCGCGQEIIIKPYLKHYKSFKYFPKYIQGHWDKDIPRTKKEKNNISKSKKGKYCGEDNPNYKNGLPKCLICNKELSNYNNIYCTKHRLINYKNLENLITPLLKRIRASSKMVEWKSQIRGRDNWTCRRCGQKGWMIAHHIKQFSIIMKEYYIKTLEEALSCDGLWDLNNGITYCKDCHDLLKHKGGLL